MPGKFLTSRGARKTLRHVSRLLGDQVLTLVDIGSAGGVEPRWKQITRKTSYIGFEPDARSNLDAEGPGKDFASYKVIPAAVWSHDGELTINLCRKPQVSSHFFPNAGLLGKFPRPERFDVVDSATVSANRLDTLNIAHCDFIKLDIQGGELAALRGGEKLLEKALGLEIEVEFLSVYRDQPLFGEVCAYLAGLGFEFIDFTNLCRWDRRVRTGLGQCVFGDALFLKSPEHLKQKLDAGSVALPDIKRYLAILALYRRVDLMATALDLFRDALQQEPDAIANIDYVIGNLNREFGRVRLLTKIAGWVLKRLGNNMRLHLTY